MDASDWKEINISDIGRSAVKSGNIVRKCLLFLLQATKMSHFRLASAGCGVVF
ncbi:hypothetical protein [Pararhizobium polonicum]|uniref:hypothetical protein n=1 Tax=Pararhizobium polonicum TaxID=1612624 RepID=UPI001314E8CA|nr:hypothetical protein [Pararhizobium polonicum]